MSERMKWTVLLCSIYDVDFRKLAEKHRIGIREDLSKKLDFVLTDASYNV